MWMATSRQLILTKKIITVVQKNFELTVPTLYTTFRLLIISSNTIFYKNKLEILNPSISKTGVIV